MNSNELLWLLSFLQAAFSCAFGAISVIPQHFIVQHTENGLPQGNLTIFCQSTRALTHAVTFIQIRKQEKEKLESIPLVTLTKDMNGGYPIRESGLSGRDAAVQGAVNDDSPQESFLRLELADASCLDEGTFICQITFYQDGASNTEMMIDSANVSTTTLPDRVLVHQKPPYDSFLINQTVELHCAGQAGSPSAWLLWEWRQTGTNASKDSEFQRLHFGVLYPEGPYPQGFCRYFRASTLYLRATEDLDGVEIRCVPVKGVHKYVNLTNSFTFKVKEAGCVPDCWNGGKCIENRCHCPEHFAGSFCEEPAAPLPCHSHKCQELNRGTIMTSSVFTCMLLSAAVVFWMYGSHVVVHISLCALMHRIL